MGYSELKSKVDQGIEGRNVGIPLCLPNLSGVTNGLQKQVYTLIGGNSGVGKTAFTDYVYVLKIYDWWLANRDKTDLKIRWIYRSMERSKTYKIAKWTCVKLYEDHRILIDVPELLGWEKSTRMESIRPILDSMDQYFDELLDLCEILDGAENPTGVYNHMRAYAAEHGKITKINDFESKYVEDDPNLMTIIIVDHIGKSKPERDFNKKQTIDKLSEYLSIGRDFYNFNPIAISQFNRDIGNIERFKNREVTPQLEDFKDSSNTQEDADLILGLFNPLRYKLLDHMGYDVAKFNDRKGNNRFRSVSCLKNSFGVDDIRVALNFIGECGIFKELPHPDKFTSNTSLYNQYML